MSDCRDVACAHKAPTQLTSFGEAEYESECSFSGESGLKRNKDRCKKHGTQKHEQFIEAASLRVNQLPDDIRSENMFTLIKSCSDLTVRIDVRYVSEHRPEKFPDSRYGNYPHKHEVGGIRTGSGFVIKVSLYGTGCPCNECRSSVSPRGEWAAIVVRTATHVVFDVSELEKTKVDFFYNDDDGRNVERVTMYPIVEQDSGLPSDSKFYVDSDTARFMCITHDMELAGKLSNDVGVYENMLIGEEFLNFEDKNPCVVISHPHGCGKCITFGSVDEVIIMHPEGWDIELSDNVYILSYNAPTCPGSSGAVVLWKRFYFVHSGSFKVGNGSTNRSGRSHAFMCKPSNLEITTEEMTKEQYKELYRTIDVQKHIEACKSKLRRLIEKAREAENDTQLQNAVSSWMTSLGDPNEDTFHKTIVKPAMLTMHREFFHELKDGMKKDKNEILLSLLDIAWKRAKKQLSNARAGSDSHETSLYDSVVAAKLTK